MNFNQSTLFNSPKLHTPSDSSSYFLRAEMTNEFANRSRVLITNDQKRYTSHERVTARSRKIDALGDFRHQRSASRALLTD